MKRQEPADPREAIAYDPDELAVVVAAAARLKRQAEHWWVEVPEEWYVPDDDGALFIGGLYHERLKAKIRTARLIVLSCAVALLAGLITIISFFTGVI